MSPSSTKSLAKTPEMAVNARDGQYPIVSSDHRCVCCEDEVTHGAVYFSTVLFTQDSFCRSNYCLSCWQGESAPTEVFAFWKTRRPEAPSAEPRKMRFDAVTVLEFFRKLVTPTAAGSETAPETAAADAGADDADAGGDDAGAGEENVANENPGGEGPAGVAPIRVASGREELGFVLALLLIRKKILSFESAVHRDGVEWLKLSERGESSNEHWVRNPDLGDEDLARVREDLGVLLHMNV